MKAKHYAFLATTFHLPSARTVSDYLSPGAHAPDGILYDVLKMQREEFEKELKIERTPLLRILLSGYIVVAYASIRKKEKKRS